MYTGGSGHGVGQTATGNNNRNHNEVNQEGGGDSGDGDGNNDGYDDDSEMDDIIDDFVRSAEMQEHEDEHQAETELDRALEDAITNGFWHDHDGSDSQSDTTLESYRSEALGAHNPRRASNEDWENEFEEDYSADSDNSGLDSDMSVWGTEVSVQMF